MSEKRTVKYFKAAKRTNRWHKGQKVWVQLDPANHLFVWYRFRSKGRYVRGQVSTESSALGEVKRMEVDKDFAVRIWDGHDYGDHFKEELA